MWWLLPDSQLKTLSKKYIKIKTNYNFGECLMYYNQIREAVSLELLSPVDKLKKWKVVLRTKF